MADVKPSGTKIAITPLCGVAGQANLCYLLEVADLCVLLDCGWTDDRPEELIEPLREVAPRVTAVLLSHPDVAHLGALPYAVSKLGLKAPVFCTTPVRKMGHHFLQDLCRSRATDEAPAFALEDVDAAFHLVQDIKYSQTVTLSPKGSRSLVTATPFPAGHLLGGSVWRITVDAEEIVYAVNFFLGKERLLQPADFAAFARPSLLITAAPTSEQPPKPQRIREAELCDIVVRTLRAGGSVLLPCSPGGRALELILLLTSHWREKRNLDVYQIVLLSSVSDVTIEVAKSSLEWMTEAIAEDFQRTRENPFHLGRRVRLCRTMEDLDRLGAGPKVILASLASLEGGPSRELLLNFSKEANSSVVLTDSSAARGEAGEWLLRHAGSHANSRPPMPLTLAKHVPLRGAKLEAWKEQKRAEKAAKEAEAAAAAGVPQGAPTPMQEDDAPADDPTPEDAAENPLAIALAAAATEGEDALGQRECLVEGFRLQPGKQAVFPFAVKQRETSEYGETITYEDFAGGAGLDGAVGATAGPDDQGPQLAIKAAPHVDEEPTEVVRAQFAINMACNVHYVDFEGLVDGRSVRNIIKNMQPRRVALVHGEADAALRLKAFCEEALPAGTRVLAPAVGEACDFSVTTTSFNVRLDEALYERAAFQRCGEYEVAWVDGALAQPSAASGGKRALGPLPQGVAPPHHDGVFIGDVRLSDFRQARTGAGVAPSLSAVLVAAGESAEFVGGALVCAGGRVIVRKEAQTDELSLEGAVSEHYFRIRSLLYSRFAIV